MSLLSECTHQRVALRALCVLSRCFAIICSFLFNIFSTNTHTHTHLQKNKTQMYLQLFDDACTMYSPRFLQLQFLFRGDYNIVCFNGKLARPHSVALTRDMRLRAHLRRIARGIWTSSPWQAPSQWERTSERERERERVREKRKLFALCHNLMFVLFSIHFAFLFCFRCSKRLGMCLAQLLIV